MTKELTKNNTFNLVYKREYQDSEDYDFFPIYYTIFRNVPEKYINRCLNKIKSIKTSVIKISMKLLLILLIIPK